jgi:DNA-binding CsgD family transcriptional regulator
MSSHSYLRTYLSPVFVGRAAQLQLLSEAMERAQTGSGATVLIAGEAGIGKSRLVHEVLNLPVAHDFVLLQGRCFEQDETLPYAPWIDLLRGSNILESFSKDSAVLHSLAPLLPVISPHSRSARGLTLKGVQEKYRLFNALFRALTAHRPTLVLIEDIHWSDDVSLEFLLYLARRIESQAFLLLLTSRSEEASPSLRAFLTTLERERRAAQIRLEHLDFTGVADMVSAILKPIRPLPAEFMQAMYEWTEGIPFFVEEILSVLPNPDEVNLKSLINIPIPRTIRQTVQTRIQQLSENARTLVTLAAVAGRQFDFALLQIATGQNERVMLESIKELIAAQVIVEETPPRNGHQDQFAFRHALTRETIYAELLQRERASLHQILLSALEKICEDAARREERMTELAFHAFESGAWKKAIQYAQRAGEQAEAFYSPRSVVEQYTRALQAAYHLGDTALDLIPVYRARGHAFEMLGEFEPARADFLQVLDLARTRRAQHAEWQALLDLGFLWASRDAHSTQTYLEQALYVARSLNEQAILARTLNRVGNWHAISLQPSRAYLLHQEALEIFEMLSDEAGRAETLDLLAVAHLIGGDFVKSIEYYERTIPLWRTLGERRGLSSSLSALAVCNASYTGSVVVTPLIPLRESVKYGEEATQLAYEIDWRAGETIALAAMAIGLGGMGEYGRAFDSARQALQIAQEIGHQQYTTVANWVLGALYLDVLAHDLACTFFEKALLDANSSTPNWIPLSLSYLATAYLEQNDYSRAEGLLNTFLTPDLGARATGERFVWTVQGELALAQGDAKLARSIAERLVQAADDETYGIGAMPRVALLYGRALIASRRKAEAAKYLEAVIETAQVRGLRNILWRALIARGKLFRTMARGSAARETFDEARRLIQTLSDSIEDVAVRENFSKRALGQIPLDHSLTSEDLQKKRFGGLSARERQIATRIARGESNREIAGELIVSQRTVESHVANIMLKLGLSSRAQIAAWAVERGLKGEN